MKKQFSLTEVQHELGVAPATAERISGLMNGKIDPDNFRSLLDDFPLAEFGIRKDKKALYCIAQLLNGKVRQMIGSGGVPVEYVKRGDNDVQVPTVILDTNIFVVQSVQNFARMVNPRQPAYN